MEYNVALYVQHGSGFNFLLKKWGNTELPMSRLAESTDVIPLPQKTGTSFLIEI